MAVAGQLVTFTEHAARRWQEHRGAPFSDALRQLAFEVTRHGAITRRRPRGVELRTLKHKLTTVGWLTLEDGSACFPLVNYGGELVATTCIARSA